MYAAPARRQSKQPLVCLSLSLPGSDWIRHRRSHKTINLLQFLLWAQLRGVSALLLAAVLGACWKTSVALAADLAVAVIFLGQKGKGWVHSTTTKTKNQMKGGFLLDVVVTQSTAIFQLFSGKDKTLLIRGDTFLVLDLLLDIFDGITRFDIQSDGLARKGFYKDLHDNDDKKRCAIKSRVWILLSVFLDHFVTFRSTFQACACVRVCVSGTTKVVVSSFFPVGLY